MEEQNFFCATPTRRTSAKLIKSRLLKFIKQSADATLSKVIHLLSLYRDKEQYAVLLFIDLRKAFNLPKTY